jgi:hypothetical protein
MTHPLDRIGLTAKDREFLVWTVVVLVGLVAVFVICAYVDDFLVQQGSTGTAVPQ